MEVDFNSLRKQAVYAYERLAKKLNYHIEKGDCSVSFDDEKKPMLFLHEPSVIIPARELDELMGDLRQYIGTIAMLSDDEDANVRDVFSEIFPPDPENPTGGPSMTVFNPDENGE